MLARKDYHAAVINAASKHDVDPFEVLGRSKENKYVYARWEAWFTIWRDHEVSPLEISKLVGRDHSTVRDGIFNHCERNGLAYSGRPVIFTSIRATQ